jgi:hypothetical protein
MGERVTVVVRRLLGLTVVLGFSALSVATSAPLNYVRGEVAVTEATASGAPGARAKVFVLLPVEDDAGQPMVHTVTLDEDGEGEWPTLWHDQMSARAVSDFQQPLLVAWAPGRGDVQRLYLDAELEQEGRYRALLLDHNYFVARSFFRLAALGHAPALEVHEGGGRSICRRPPTRSRRTRWSRPASIWSSRVHPASRVRSSRCGEAIDRRRA